VIPNLAIPLTIFFIVLLYRVSLKKDFALTFSNLREGKSELINSTKSFACSRQSIHNFSLGLSEYLIKRSSLLSLHLSQNGVICLANVLGRYEKGAFANRPIPLDRILGKFSTYIIPKP
jgi:hypothetical protein